MGPARNITEELGGLHSRLEDLQSEAYDVSETLRDMADAMEFSPQELDNLESRLDQLYRLKKKYGATVEDMLDYLDQCGRSWTGSPSPPTRWSGWRSPWPGNGSG